MRRNRIFLLVSLIVVIGTFAATMISSTRPQLGLDLKGGISIRLFPIKGTANDLISTARDIIDRRVNGLGIAEPEVSVQGTTIVVDLPGVKDRAKAEQLVGTTAELENREVLGQLPENQKIPPTTTTKPAATTTTKPGSTTTTVKGATTTTGASTTTIPGATTTTNAKISPAPNTSTTKGNGAASRTIHTVPIAATTPTTPTTARSATTTVKGATTTTIKGATTTTVKGATTTTVAANDLTGKTCKDLVPSVRPASSASGFFWAKNHKDGCYYLGKNLLPASDLSTATANYDPTNCKSSTGWCINATYKGTTFADAIGQPMKGKPVAIVLDGLVLSAPTIDAGGITGSNVQISGQFSESEAKGLAQSLKYGSLPVRFDDKNRTVENVSPTLGQDQLHAGIAAGLIGLALVALYMLFFYRILGLVVWLGLAMTGMVMFVLTTWLGQWQGLTLTLSGITGIIVSVGVTVDSYVVYFERLKDEVRTGKTVRSSVETGWKRAWKTILAADAVSLIGAGVLYVMTIGSVKGFAFFLALSTLVDLALAVLYMHPLVSVMSRRSNLVAANKFGIAAGLDVAGRTAV